MNFATPLESWSESAQDWFIQEAYKTYRLKYSDPRPEPYTFWDRWRGRPKPPLPVINEEYLSWLYKLGRDYGYLKLDFLEFKVRIAQSPAYHFRPYRGYFYERHKVGYREKLPKVGHKTTPKIMTESEQNRRDWRERKGFTKDKAKRQQCRRGRKCFVCSYSNRKHRAWEKRMIAKEDWDNMIGDYTKVTHDPWMWD